MVGRFRERGAGTMVFRRGVVAVLVLISLQVSAAMTGIGFAQSNGASDPALSATSSPSSAPSSDSSEPTVLVGDIVIEGAFHESLPEISAQIDELIASLVGRRATASELYNLSLAVEAAYQSAGYFLTRVTIPPQELDDGGTLRMTVIEGYLEAVDLQGVPTRVHPYLNAVFAPILNRPRVTVREFERALVLARQAPGLSVQTTLVPGTDVGSGVLVVEGDRTPYSTSLNFSSRLSAANPTWNASASLQIFQPFGSGEQWTLNVSGPVESLLPPYDGGKAASRSGGGSLRWPIGGDGKWLQLSFSGSYTFTPSIHWLIPDTRQTSRQITLEYNHPIYLRQDGELRISGALDASDEVMDVPDFDVEVYRDEVRVLRLGADWRRETRTGGQISASLALAKGLEGMSRGPDEVAASGVPLQRPEADPGFAKLSLTALWRYPFADRFSLTTVVRGQYALSGLVPMSELFGVTGDNGLPSLGYTVEPNDHGWTVREEIDAVYSLFGGRANATLFAYVAAGLTSGGIASDPEIARGAGIGVRGRMGPVNVTLEQMWGWSGGFEVGAWQAGVEVAF
ncbi:MAG: ShlB/FhaC/HecB family hemolysin secretion/activation protein [Firmicutes bacterium]|nr:ShlB/FhaC/HecB family hemolysin secretion/activation protein [Bacillota bacterium]